MKPGSSIWQADEMLKEMNGEGNQGRKGTESQVKEFYLHSVVNNCVGDQSAR